MPKFEAAIAHGPASNPIQAPAERPADGVVDMPSHYLGCVELTRPWLRVFGFTDDELDMECIYALELPDRQWILQDSFIKTTVVYLWRAGEKDPIKSCLGKALWYLERGYEHPGVALTWANLAPVTIRRRKKMVTIVAHYIRGQLDTLSK